VIDFFGPTKIFLLKLTVLFQKLAKKKKKYETKAIIKQKIYPVMQENKEAFSIFSVTKKKE
jgi:hypothetical protein